MAAQEGQDVHALWLHTSHHYHWHEHRTEAADIAIAQPCLIAVLQHGGGCRRREQIPKTPPPSYQSQCLEVHISPGVAFRCNDLPPCFLQGESLHHSSGISKLLLLGNQK